VLIWAHHPVSWDRVQAMMREFESLENCPDRDVIVQALQRAVPEYEPLNPPPKTPNQETRQPKTEF